MTTATVADWHDLECGSYVADLPVWRRLAAEAAGPVLDVGAGTGRVSLDLAARGHEVVALDVDARLLGVLARRAGRGVTTVRADARDFHLGRTFALVLVPMQTAQLLGGPAGRRAFLACARDHLRRDGRVAVALADPLETIEPDAPGLPRPDLSERDGLVFSSQPVRMRRDAGAWVIERLRQVVFPDGRRTEEHDEVRLDDVLPGELEGEARAVGLAPAGRHRVEETPEYIGSEVVVLARG